MYPLRLPELDDEGQPGSRFVRHAVSLTLAILALLAVMGTAAAFLVRVDVTVEGSGSLEPVRAAGAHVGAGELLPEVADPRKWRARLYVRERDAHRIRPGDPVRVEVPALAAGERELPPGRVLSVAPEGAGSGEGPPAPAAAGLYEVVFSLDRDQLHPSVLAKLRRGYTVEGRIVTRSARIADLLWDHLREKRGP